jgi:nitroreductase
MTELTPPPGPAATVRERALWAVDAARFAPSKRNTQPWAFAVAADGTVDVYADATRALRVSDPDERELTIGCGAALHTYAVALRGLGVRPVVTWLPEGDDGPLGRVAQGGRVVPSADGVALLAAVPARHSARGRVDASTLDTGVPPALQRAAESEGALLQLVTAPGSREALAALHRAAADAAAANVAYAAEQRVWSRPFGSAARDGVPRVVTSGPPYGARAAALLESEDRALPAVLWTANDTQADWLRAGAALQAVLLRATLLGVAAAIASGPLERPALRVAVRRHVGYAGFPQVLLRFGTVAHALATPRRPLAEVVR